LPKINLPTFDGSFDKWESFRDKFKSMIHEDQNLTNVERMHYLCSYVKGDASNVLDYLANNFAIAWNIPIHLQSLFNLPSLTTESSKQNYYIPHHAILRDSSAIIRLRVVFNASCRTSNGMSLNDHMLVGPKFQKDLSTGTPIISA
ncbi:hypothetical protein ALC56_03625, partial [Trachymyrmex septentrionalis]